MCVRVLYFIKVFSVLGAILLELSYLVMLRYASWPCQRAQHNVIEFDRNLCAGFGGLKSELLCSIFTHVRTPCVCDVAAPFFRAN